MKTKTTNNSQMDQSNHPFGIFSKQKIEKSFQQLGKKDDYGDYKKQKRNLTKWIAQYPSIVQMLKACATVGQIMVRLDVDIDTVKKVFRAQQKIECFGYAIKSQKIIKDRPHVVEMLKKGMSPTEIDRQTCHARQSVTDWSDILENAKNNTVDEILDFKDIDKSTQLYVKLEKPEIPEKTAKELKLIATYTKKHPAIIDDILLGMIPSHVYNKYKKEAKNPDGRIGYNNAKSLAKALQYDVVQEEDKLPEGLTPIEFAQYYITHLEIPTNYFDLADGLTEWYADYTNIEGTDIDIESEQADYDNIYGINSDDGDDDADSYVSEKPHSEKTFEEKKEFYDELLRIGCGMWYSTHDTPKNEVDYLLELEKKGLVLKHETQEQTDKRHANYEKAEKEDKSEKIKSRDEFGNTTDHLHPLEQGRPTEANKQFIISQRKIAYWVDLMFLKHIATAPEIYFAHSVKEIKQSEKKIKDALMSMYKNSVRNYLDAMYVVEDVIDNYINEFLSDNTEDILKCDKRTINKWVDGRLDNYHFAYLTEHRKQFAIELHIADDCIREDLDKLTPYMNCYKQPVEFKKWLDVKGHIKFFKDFRQIMIVKKKLKNVDFEHTSFPPVDHVIKHHQKCMNSYIKCAKQRLHQKHPELKFILEASKEALARQAKRAEIANKLTEKKELTIQRNELVSQEQQKQQRLQHNMLEQSLGLNTLLTIENIGHQLLHNSFNFYQDCWDIDNPASTVNKKLVPEAFTVEFQKIRKFLMIVCYNQIEWIMAERQKPNNALLYSHEDDNSDFDRRPSLAQGFTIDIEWSIKRLP